MPRESIPLLSEENIVHEEVLGLKIASDGVWSQSDTQLDSQAFMQKVMSLRMATLNLRRLVTGDTTVTESGNNIIAEQDKTQSFGPDGIIPDIKFKCPECGKEVERLLKNGYCSASCAVSARVKALASSTSNAAKKVNDILMKVKSMLSLLDLALNVITLVPEILRDSVKLPEEYREFVILEIEIMFMELKKIFNNLEIRRNEYIMELMNRIKFGALEDKLAKILAPVQAIIQTIIALQTTLNATIASLMAMMKLPAFGSIPPNGGHGFMLSAKSFQFPLTAGKIFINNEPTVNMAFPLSAIINVIDTEKIQMLIRKALPDIQPVEYFMDPTAFKIRWALSPENCGMVKKILQMLELITVRVPAECFPRYKNLSLIRPFFVLAIFTGWGPLTRNIFGDFIFHAVL